MSDFLEHPYIRSKTIQARVYQQILFVSSIKNNTLVVLPTGLGKTVIFIMVVAFYLNKSPEKQSGMYRWLVIILSIVAVLALLAGLRLLRLLRLRATRGCS